MNFCPPAMIRNGTGQISFQLMKSLGFQSNTYRNEALGDYLTLRGYVQERFFCLKRISPKSTLVNKCIYTFDWHILYVIHDWMVLCFPLFARSSSSSRAEHCKRTSKIASLAFIFTMKYIVPWSTQMAPDSHEFGHHSNGLWISWNFYDHRLAPDFFGKTPSRDSTTNFQDLK